MSTSSFRKLTHNRELKVGVFIGEFTTPGIGRIIKSSGCDFAMVDMEHTGFTFETVKQTLRYLHDAGLASMVRPPSKEYHHIARACDVGAQGVMPPMLGTAEKARQIVRYMKYVPEGRRGVCLGISHDNYSTGSVAETFAAANQKTSLVALIETAEGIANVDEIAAVDGVDCLWIGHFDLSSSLGIPGQFDHPEFTSAVERVIAAAKTHNKSLGRMVTTVEEGAALHAAGFDIIMYSGDIWLLQMALTTGVRQLRTRCRNQ
jgi:2-keto-3-deoxy-L-rhamnonate aldolase RhmA